MSNKLQPVYLICGVPGSGKTWIANQLKNFDWIPHDENIGKDYSAILIAAAHISKRPVLGECPFMMGKLVEELKNKDIEVHTYFINEDRLTVQRRYENRENKPIPKQHLSNLHRYLYETKHKGRKWDGMGTSQEILDLLKDIQGENK